MNQNQKKTGLLKKTLIFTVRLGLSVKPTRSTKGSLPKKQVKKPGKSAGKSVKNLKQKSSPKKLASVEFEFEETKLPSYLKPLPKKYRKTKVKK